MRRKDSEDKIIYSDKINDFLEWLNFVRFRYQESQDYLRYANDATQDLLHAIELCVTTIQERNSLYNQLSDIRRKRRCYKNEEAVLTPIILWIRSHPTEIESLSELITLVAKIEENINGPKYYRSRTGVIEELFNGVNVLGDQIEGEEELSDETENDTSIDKISHPNEQSGKYQSYPGEGRVEVILQYPVVLFHTKNRKAYAYYYVFPGIEELVIPHCFPCGDPAMNVKNKKLLFDIAHKFTEVLKQHHGNIPDPMKVSDVNSQEIRNTMALTSITETRVIVQDFSCYQRKDSM